MDVELRRVGALHVILRTGILRGTRGPRVEPVGRPTTNPLNGVPQAKKEGTLMGDQT